MKTDRARQRLSYASCRLLATKHLR